MSLVPALLAVALCRYTVRDIGFVDLVGSSYSLARVGASDPTVDPEAALRDTNLSFSTLPLEATADPRVGAAGPAGGWVLHREGLAPLGLVHLGASVEEALDAALSSESRDALIARTVDSFAVLLVFDSVEEPLTDRLHAEIAAAREGLDLLSAQLPRPIVRPLAELRVPRDRRPDERVLLWSLGLEVQDPGAAVAVVYGRGRLAGDVLVGEAIERGELLAQLALVGESCECDTDRDWLGAPSLPLAWAAEPRARAAADLGFDPESPLVRAEVTRILARGRPAGPNARGRGVDDVVFGYGEAALEVVGSSDDPVPSGTPAHEVRVFEATGGDDWGFEDRGTGDRGTGESSPPPEPARTERRLDPLLVAGLGVLVLVAAGVGVVVLTRGPR